MMSYEDMKDIVYEVYDLYMGGLSDNPDGSLAYLVDSVDLYGELSEEDSRTNKEIYVCQTKRAFAYFVYFVYVFLKGGQPMVMGYFNCYYRSRNKFACKELEKEMDFIEKFYEDNFDMIPTEREKPEFFPKNYKPKNQ